ncbi:DNA cytosine methyltransferase, partial [Wenyingzhuangia sp. 1_MG-2023]|nr:DNA cytosine methyltransferase [Wenyingzhuangia sp. 1_MG-2023]
MSSITCTSYFSGAGLMDIGLMQAGIDVVSAYELDDQAVKTYRHNIGHHINQADLAQELVAPQADTDVMAFTYPCTRYSRMADIQGTR